MRSVTSASAAPHVHVSYDRSQCPLGPPKPFHLETGTRTSKPPRSAVTASFRCSSQLLICIGPSSVLIPPAPPATLIPKTPNFSLLGLVKIRDSDREMVPSAMGRVERG